jgi:hypothetical protein
MQATQLWHHWQAVLQPFQDVFTAPGSRRFMEWITGLVLNSEEHTVTQSLIGVQRPQDWKTLEAFVEYGAWERDRLEQVATIQLVQTPTPQWYGYYVWAGDDTKVHRNSSNVWGTCTYHEYTARCPNRASTVRAHNWVVLGALLPQEQQPAWFMPQSARLYFRRTQLPPGEVFQTKNDLLVQMLRCQAKCVAGKHLAVFDGAFAVWNVVHPLVFPEPGQARVEFLTRLRKDAYLCDLPPPPEGNRRGPKPKWGPRLPQPGDVTQWHGTWHKGKGWIYGRLRTVRWQERVCLWRVLGWQVKVKVVIAEVSGYSKPFTLVSSALELTGVQMVELFAARFRQEDGFRDTKQRLGWEECRAWTKEPILRTTQAELLSLTLLRLLQIRLDAEHGDTWWYHPPWNPHKTRPSVLDLKRLWWDHRPEIQRLLSEQLTSLANSA